MPRTRKNGSTFLLLSFLIFCPAKVMALVWFNDPEVRLSVEVAYDQHTQPDRASFNLKSSFSLNRPTTLGMTREIRFALSKDPFRGASYEKPAPPSEDFKDFLTDVELVTSEIIPIKTTKKVWSKPISPTMNYNPFTLRGLFTTKTEEDYRDKEEHLSFHLVALVYVKEDSLKKPFYYWQSLPVFINITRPGTVVVEGLDDVILETGKTARMKACINSSTGRASILLDGENSHSHGYNRNQEPPAYRLSDYGSPPRFVPYFIELRGPEEERQIKYEGFESEKFWTVDKPLDDGSCTQESFIFRFNTNEFLALAAGTGVYSDRITVVVSPE